MELVLCFSVLCKGNDIDEVMSVHIFHLWLTWIASDKEFGIVEGVFTKIYEVILQNVYCKNSPQNNKFHKIKISLRYDVNFMHFLLW
jgi:hypothetical protein